MDFHTELRQRMTDVMQSSLRSVRQALGFGVQEFGEAVGLTRQSINNLENEKSRMSTTQFLAVCAVIDHFTELQPDLLPVIKSILNSNDISQENAVFSNIENNSFLKKWFLCFPVNSRFTIRTDMDIIKELSENYKIFLDDTAICEMQEEGQTAALMEYMQQNENRFIVPVLAADEIQSRFVTERDEYSRQGIEMLTRLKDKQLVEFRGEKTDMRLITTLKSVFIKFKMIHRLALITQSRKLAEAILSLNDDDEIGGFEISVFRFCEYGILCDWKNYEEEQDKYDETAEDEDTDCTQDDSELYEEEDDDDEYPEYPEFSEYEDTDCTQDDSELYDEEDDDDEYPESNPDETFPEIPSGWDLI